VKTPRQGWERENFILCSFDPKADGLGWSKSESEMLTLMNELNSLTDATVEFATILLKQI
jgi:hypothetical protein